MLSTFCKFSLVLLALLPSAGPASAQTVLEPIVLWPQGAPNEKGDVPEEKQLPMKPGDPTIRITNVTRPMITVYRPAAEKSTGAAVVICPGGGYGGLAYNKEGTDVAEWLNTIGVSGIVLKYRVPARKDRPRHAAPLEDAQRAMGIVRQRAKEWNIDSARVGALGFSAGGHLSAALSTNFAQRTYEPIDAADRESCRPDFAVLVYPAYLALKDQNNALPPELVVTSDTPRTFLVQTQDDGVRVESSVFYYLALKRAGVSSEMHLYPTGGHGYGLRPSPNTVSTWPARVEDWLRSQKLLERTN